MLYEVTQDTTLSTDQNTYINIFTDGSQKSMPEYNHPNRKASGAGVVIYDIECNIDTTLTFSLGTLASNNQCELFAIEQAALWIAEHRKSPLFSKFTDTFFLK